MKVIGRKEKIDLPELNLLSIDCKIDTGARTSSIHCEEIYLSKSKHHSILHFKLLDKSHPEYQNVVHSFDKFRIQKVKSSSGHSEKRYVITTKVRVFDELIETEFNLANRKAMNYPILLGRKFLLKRFLVDVSKRNLSFKKDNDKTT
jgi:hypothetical protein